MDFIYNDGSKDLSLQKLTTTIIIQKILEDEGMLPNCKRHKWAIASRAIEVVNNLPLPLLLKCQLRAMVLPITDEMQSWYQYKNEATRVVLTQNGTVDWPKSTRNLLNDENVSIMQRFEVACDYCLEQEIFDIGAQMNFPHNFGISEPDSTGYMVYNAKLWYKIYEGNFHAKLSRKDISENYCTQGFFQQLYKGNSVGLKYFAEGASSWRIGEYFLHGIRSTFFARSFTPDVCIKIFKILNKNERQQLKSRFSAALLNVLLKWPYQHQFLKAAESLMKNMDSKDFFQVAAMIVKKARDDWEDHGYKGLFIDFWKLGSKFKISYIQPKGYVMELLYDVILMRDERLAHFVLDNTTDEFKTKHLFNFCDSVCMQLIFEKHFVALELFMKVCRINNVKFILKFQKDILQYLGHGFPCRDIFLTSIDHLNNEKLKNILLEFLSRMDKIEPQMS